PRAFQLEDRRSLLDPTGDTEIHLGDTSVDLGKDRHRPVKARDAGRGRVVVEDHRDQAHRENDAAGDPPTQLEPYGENGYFLADPFVLDIPAEQIVRQNGQHRAEKDLKHEAYPSCSRIGSRDLRALARRYRLQLPPARPRRPRPA